MNTVEIYSDYLNNSSPIFDGDRSTEETAVLGMLRQPSSGGRGLLTDLKLCEVGSG